MEEIIRLLHQDPIGKHGTTYGVQMQVQFLPSGMSSNCSTSSILKIEVRGNLTICPRKFVGAADAGVILTDA